MSLDYDELADTEPHAMILDDGTTAAELDRPISYRLSELAELLDTHGVEQ